MGPRYPKRRSAFGEDLRLINIVNNMKTVYGISRVKMRWVYSSLFSTSAKANPAAINKNGSKTAIRKNLRVYMSMSIGDVVS